MITSKADIIARLQKEILPLQGFKPFKNGTVVDLGTGPINDALPNGIFPLGAIHEFICTKEEDAAASTGFIAGVLASLMREGGASVWISSCHKLFPPALTTFGIGPEKIIFIDLQKEKDITWAIEEALQCVSLAAVVGEVQDLSFTNSRRLQLAVEQSRLTGFIIRRKTRQLNTTASVARWKINHLPGIVADDLPGVGFPRWKVELLKIRNGKPGIWEMEWVNKRFGPVFKQTITEEEKQKKTG